MRILGSDLLGRRFRDNLVEQPGMQRCIVCGAENSTCKQETVEKADRAQTRPEPVTVEYERTSEESRAAMLRRLRGSPSQRALRQTSQPSS